MTFEEKKVAAGVVPQMDDGGADIELIHNTNTIKTGKMKKMADEYQKRVEAAYKTMKENEGRGQKNYRSAKEFLCEIDEKYKMLC